LQSSPSSQHGLAASLWQAALPASSSQHPSAGSQQGVGAQLASSQHASLSQHAASALQHASVLLAGERRVRQEFIEGLSASNGKASYPWRRSPAELKRRPGPGPLKSAGRPGGTARSCDSGCGCGGAWLGWCMDGTHFPGWILPLTLPLVLIVERPFVTT
jgi:hypothetical protein